VNQKINPMIGKNKKGPQLQPFNLRFLCVGYRSTKSPMKVFSITLNVYVKTVGQPQLRMQYKIKV